MRVMTSSVVSASMSSGMSAHVSCAGWSGVVSIAVSSVGAEDEDDAEASGAFSGFAGGCGGWLGGGADMANAGEGRVAGTRDARR
jgi:hypothetical protein